MQENAVATTLSFNEASTVFPSTRDRLKLPNLHDFAGKMRAIASKFRKPNQQETTLAQTAVSENSLQVVEEAGETSHTLADLAKRLTLAGAMLNDPSKIISDDTRERIRDAQKFYHELHAKLDEMSESERHQLGILLDIAALSYKNDLQIHSIQPSISSPGAGVVRTEAALLTSRTKLGDIASFADIELPFAITFTSEEERNFTGEERLAAVRLMSTILEKTKNSRLYKVSEKGNLVLTERGKREEYAALYDVIADLGIEFPHSFAKDRIQQVLSLAESKLHAHIGESEPAVKVDILIRERQNIISDVVHVATLTRMCVEDADYRKWARNLSDQEIQQIRSIHELVRSGDTTIHSQLAPAIRTHLEAYNTLYEKKKTGVMRRNVRNGEIKYQTDVKDSDSPLRQGEHALFQSASDRVNEIDNNIETAQQTRMFEGLHDRYTELRDMERMVELRRAIRIETGEENALILHDLAKKRLRDERRIAEALDLDPKSYSMADIKRIITRVYDSWKVIEDDIAHDMLHTWDGKGEPPVTFTQKGQLTEVSHNAVYDRVRSEMRQGLEQLGIRIGSTALPSQLEQQGQKLYEGEVIKRGQRIYANIVRIRSRLDGKVTKGVCDALRARDNQTILSYPQTTAEIRASRPKLIPELRREEREARARITAFINSNNALKAFTVLRGALVLPALLASGAHFVGSALNALDPDMIDRLGHDIGETMTEIENEVQHQVKHFTQAVGSFGITERVEVVEHAFGDSTIAVEGSRTVTTVEPVGPTSRMQDIPQDVIDRCLTSRTVDLGGGETMQIQGYNPAAIEDDVCQTTLPGMNFALDTPDGNKAYEITFPEPIHIPPELESHITVKDFAMNTQRGRTCLLTSITSIVNHFRTQHLNQPGLQSWVFSDLAQPSPSDEEAPDYFQHARETRASEYQIPNLRIHSFNTFHVDSAGLADKYGVAYDEFTYDDLWDNLKGEERTQYIQEHWQVIGRQIAERLQSELSKGSIPIHSQLVDEGVGHATMVLGTMQDGEVYKIIAAEPNGGYTKWPGTIDSWEKEGDNGLVSITLDANTIDQIKYSVKSFRVAQPEDLVHEVTREVPTKHHIPDFETTNTSTKHTVLDLPFTDIDIPIPFLDKT